MLLGREIGRPVGWTPEHPWSRTSVAQPAAAVKSVGANKKLKAAISRDIRQQQQQQPPEVRPELLKLQKLFRSDGDYLRVLLWLRDKVAEFDKRARVTVFSEEQREELEKKGQTLKSGADDLKDAIDALDKEFKGPKGKLKGIERGVIRQAVEKASYQAESDIVAAARETLENHPEPEIRKAAKAAVPPPAEFVTQKELEAGLKGEVKETPFPTKGPTTAR